MSSILCIGDAMVDVIVELGESINIGSDTKSKITMIGGGAAANTACWLGSSGHNVTFVGKVGADAAGEQFIADLDLHHVHHSNIKASEATTGIVVVLVDDNGERTMFPDSGANSTLTSMDLPSLARKDPKFDSQNLIHIQRPDQLATSEQSMDAIYALHVWSSCRNSQLSHCLFQI